LISLDVSLLIRVHNIVREGNSLSTIESGIVVAEVVLSSTVNNSILILLNSDGAASDRPSASVSGVGPGNNGVRLDCVIKSGNNISWSAGNITNVDIEVR
jgi:hypothetical protein